MRTKQAVPLPEKGGRIRKFVEPLVAWIGHGRDDDLVPAAKPPANLKPPAPGWRFVGRDANGQPLYAPPPGYGAVGRGATIEDAIANLGLHPVHFYPFGRR